MMEKCTLELISTYHFGSSLKYLKNCTLKDFMNMLTLKTDRGSMSYIGGQIVLCYKTPEFRGSKTEPPRNNDIIHRIECFYNIPL